MRSVGVQSSLTRSSVGEGRDDELERAAGVNLEVQRPSDRVLPQLLKRKSKFPFNAKTKRIHSPKATP